MSLGEYLNSIRLKQQNNTEALKDQSRSVRDTSEIESLLKQLKVEEQQLDEKLKTLKGVKNGNNFGRGSAGGAV
jgi:hypothetical protein